jgi:hypothetical protein
MSVYRDRTSHVSLSFACLLTCLVCLTTPALGRADGYLIEDGGLRSPAAYDKGYAGESVLVSPAGPGSFESLERPVSAPGETDETVNPDGSEADWLTVGCTACGGQGCGQCSHGTGLFQRLCGDAWPRWVVQIDALMLWQGNIASRPLFINGAGFTALDANQAQTPMSAGPRVGLFYFLDQTNAIEGNYFNVRPFDGEATALPGQTLTASSLAGFSVPGFDGAQVFTNGAIQSAELNWRRRECWCPVTWLAGFRWVEWNQQMRITEHAGGPIGSFFSETGNDLYGGQGGMELGLWNAGGPFTVNGIGKAGAFYNNAYQRTSYTDPAFTSAAAASVDRIAFFGELGVNGNLRLTDWLSWRLGYSLFWLSGVAIPANQLSTTNLAAVPPTATINTNGSVLLHGVTTGLEARW